MIKISSTNPDGKFKLVVVPEFKDTIEPPSISPEAFVEIISRRSRLGKDVAGGDEVTQFFMDQVDPDFGDGIILWMHPFEEWHKVIKDLSNKED